jgi:hypothetical protein
MEVLAVNDLKTGHDIAAEIARKSDKTGATVSSWDTGNKLNGAPCFYKAKTTDDKVMTFPVGILSKPTLWNILRIGAKLGILSFILVAAVTIFFPDSPITVAVLSFIQ